MSIRYTKGICGYRYRINIKAKVMFASSLTNLLIRSFQCEFILWGKVWHKTNNANISSLLCRWKEDDCIRELGTQTHHGSNNKADSTCILPSLICSSLNAMYVLNSVPLRWRSHGHHHLRWSRWVGFTFASDYIHHPFQNYILCATHVWKTIIQIKASYISFLGYCLSHIIQSFCH